MGNFFQESITPHFNFWVYVLIMMIGLWAVIAKNNLVKKLIGLSIFQSAIILLYVSLGVKDGASIPILPHHAEPVEIVAAAKPNELQHDDHLVDPTTIANPLPHVLMLTAIVVGVATLGVALALCQRIFAEFGSLEEHELLTQLKAGPTDE
jgi:multicomponent Na+:H+ antiporter subunit C